MSCRYIILQLFTWKILLDDIYCILYCIYSVTIIGDRMQLHFTFSLDYGWICGQFCMLPVFSHSRTSHGFLCLWNIQYRKWPTTCFTGFAVLVCMTVNSALEVMQVREVFAVGLIIFSQHKIFLSCPVFWDITHTLPQPRHRNTQRTVPAHSTVFIANPRTGCCAVSYSSSTNCLD